MTYLLNKSQKAIQKTTMEFAKGEFDKDAAREYDKRAAFPLSIWKKAADLGFIGIHLPETFSGGGMSHLENVLVAETFAGKDSTTGAAIMLAGVAAEWLARFGNQEQKSRLLPEILEGRMRSGAAIIQPTDGRQNAFIGMQAAASGVDWRINGELDGVINGREAEIFFVLCNDSMNADEPDRVSMLAVEADKAGINLEKDHAMLGLRMTGTARIKFDDVSVSQQNLIGKRDQGLKQAKRILPEFRMLLAALALGTAQGAFDRALAYVKERGQFGRKIAEFQVTRHKLANMALQIEQARCLTYRAASQFDPGKVDTKMTAMANLAATRAAVKVSFEAIQLFGGYGYTIEYEVERCYRDAKTLQLLSGYGNDLTEDIAAAVIGRLKS
jgi:alkylation response protein AidB-like acyl-CoA dehydrogenase